ncbi:PREDICTED: putative leucine-rich repeat-containing protein DDB_G0290503 isoform X2 [Dinoponera quadriceps]|uniref:Leucine-rich repeat-containing protein DDB_G0290503 isoform X2 n=1 Tax=Dinoponera quadriceps TaxID=609295 RepID=A0A6P3X9D1_DINQU|nr:PREDICTED: putative leucine-rich repeat-containing protein DDB_G0290503 isoform X2 [Dinoponera quadriceps]
MTSDYMTNSVNNSQDFILQLSEESITEDRYELLGNNKKEKENSIIVISDSSCSSSPEHFDKSKWESLPVSKRKNKNVKYKRLYISETSSEDEEEKINLPWKLSVISDKYLNKKHIDSVQDHKTFYISNETAIITSSSDMSDDRTPKKQTSKFNSKKSYRSTTLTPMRQEIRQSDTDAHKEHEIYNVRETNKIITPSSVSSSIQNKLNQFTIRNTPQQNNVGRVELTKEDTCKIFKNIKSTQIVYNSLREKRETNIIIDESTDRDEDIIHPAISLRNNNGINCHNDSLGVIETTLKDDIISDSQTNSSKSCDRAHSIIIIDTPKDEDLHRPLSERKKRQITQWLMTNQSDSQSDSSCSNIPASTKNSIHSGNSSLERLELNYETPNNRGQINKVHTKEKQTTITNSKGEIHLFSTRQNTLDRFVQRSKNNNSEFCTPERPMVLPKAHTDKKISSSSSVNSSENVNVKNCEDILDKLYGKSWRNKANVLLPTTEPRKKTAKTIVKAVQTERKPILKDKYYTVDLGESNSVKSNIRSDIRRKIQQRYKKQEDSFINDSLSSENSDSMYHTALTNFRISTDSTVPREKRTKPMPVSAMTRHIFSLCDTDTEDEINDKSSDSKKSLCRKVLTFSDDDSSITSEFDPEDYVPPKLAPKKKTTNTLQPPKVTTKSESITTNRFLGHKSFLESLSSTISMNKIHPDARKYRLDYKNLKEELCKKLYKLYNEKVFDDKLPRDIPIEWNVRMRGTAGYCYNKKSVRRLSGVVKSSRIVLATKILDTPDRLRDTLIHEMCHAAAWLINDTSDGHGPFWTGWANKAMRTFPELPPIRRCHDYEIKTKFTYRCTSCGYSIGRHSKSLDIEKKRCGYCYGKFELLVNKTTKSGTVQVQTSKKEPSGFALYVKQNYNSVKKEKNNIRHADVMKILGIHK